MTTPLRHRILLVDDDQSVRVVLRRGLERQGYEVHEAGEGGAALKVLAQVPADLVVTDLVMPDMEGIALILALRKSHPKLPVIAISGGGRMSPEPYLEAAQGCGAARILSKPFHIDLLLAHIRELIGPPPAPAPEAAGPKP